MSDFLEKILVHKRKLLREKEAFFDSLKSKLGREQHTRYGIFKKAISKPGTINLIAEIKKASPSAGMIRENFDVAEIAKIYVSHKADAISVLTEEKYFLGTPQYVKKVSDHFKVPVLTKDFIIHEGQIYEALFNGASAILLIVAILEKKQLLSLMEIAGLLDLDCLVEVHTEEELKTALEVNAEIIGVNSRNLHTFDVDLKTAEHLLPKIPKGKIVVAESGIQTHKDVVRLKNAGAHAVLIGETFMRAKDIGQKIDEIILGK